jgi:transcriptional regulator with GAF, ATPase, and Fis domain
VGKTFDPPDNEQNSQERLTLLERVNNLLLRICSTSDVNDVLETIVHEALALTGAAQGSIMLLNPEAGGTMRTLIRGVDRAEEGIAYRVGSSLTGWVARNRCPLLVVDIQNDPRFRGVDVVPSPLRSVLSVPLMVGGRVRGVMNLCNGREDRSFTKQDLSIARLIAEQCSQVIENARFIEDLMQREADLEDENIYLKAEIEGKFNFSRIVGTSPAMQDMYDILKKVILTPVTVLIEGETGTGKELVAQCIHHNSLRKDRKFVVQNCGALPDTLLASELFGHKKGAFTGATEDKKGLFEIANGGTIFLDEVGETSPAMQVSLLRVLEDGVIRGVGETEFRKVDVRVISATNKDLAKEVQKVRFREDLLYRLNVISIHIPPLRDRKEDIPLLLDEFLKRSRIKLKKDVSGFDAAATKVLLHYDWPGNVRELLNEVERAVTLVHPGCKIGLNILSPRIRSSMPSTSLDASTYEDLETLPQAVERLERQLIERALHEFKGNRTKAAKRLGLTRQGLSKKIQRYDISVSK